MEKPKLPQCSGPECDHGLTCRCRLEDYVAFLRAENLELRRQHPAYDPNRISNDLDALHSKLGRLLDARVDSVGRDVTDAIHFIKNMRSAWLDAHEDLNRLKNGEAAKMELVRTVHELLPYVAEADPWTANKASAVRRQLNIVEGRA